MIHISTLKTQLEWTGTTDFANSNLSSIKAMVWLNLRDIKYRWRKRVSMALHFDLSRGFNCQEPGNNNISHCRQSKCLHMLTVVAQYDPKIGCWSTRHGPPCFHICCPFYGPNLEPHITIVATCKSCNGNGQSYWIFTHLHLGFHLICWCCNCWSIVCIQGVAWKGFARGEKRWNVEYQEHTWDLANISALRQSSAIDYIVYDNERLELLHQ